MQTLLYRKTDDEQIPSGAEADRINDSGVIAEVKDDVIDSGGTLPYRHFSYKSVIRLPSPQRLQLKVEHH